MALAPGALALGLVCAVGLALSGLGHRWGWWTFQTGFAVLKWTTFGAIASGALGLAGLIAALVARSSPRALAAVAAVVVAGAVLWVPIGFMRTARSVPRIHDITTDTANPPRFVAIVERRRGAVNPAEYAGAALAAQQRAGYPDLGPADLARPPGRALEQATAAARKLGWEIVAVAPAEGRLEATATTPWFGFKDDVVVRIVPTERGSRVDVRSASRVGISDLGVNARRIRTFLGDLQAAGN